MYVSFKKFKSKPKYIFTVNWIHFFTFYIFSDQQSRWRGGKTSGHPDKVELKMPNAIPSETLSHYSPLTGLIYIFNLIVGTGALTLPAAFHDAGWLLRYVKLFKRS